MPAGATTTRSKSNTVPWKRSSSSLHACANVRELLTEGTGVRWGSDVQFRLCSERHAKWAQGLEVAMHATLPAGGCSGRDRNQRAGLACLAVAGRPASGCRRSTCRSLPSVSSRRAREVTRIASASSSDAFMHASSGAAWFPRSPEK